MTATKGVVPGLLTPRGSRHGLRHGPGAGLAREAPGDRLRRGARRFRTYDLGGDGFIEQADFQLAAGGLGEELGHKPGSPARQHATNLCLQLWQHLAQAVGTGHDGRISQAEYKTAFAAGLLVTPASFDQGYRPFLDAIMDIADVDGDGELTVDEQIRWTRSVMNLPETDSREVFRRLDTDGDGYITTRDMLGAIREYYFNDDPDSAGSWLLGALDPRQLPVPASRKHRSSRRGGDPHERPGPPNLPAQYHECFPRCPSDPLDSAAFRRLPQRSGIPGRVSPWLLRLSSFWRAFRSLVGSSYSTAGCGRWRNCWRCWPTRRWRWATVFRTGIS